MRQNIFEVLLSTRTFFFLTFIESVLSNIVILYLVLLVNITFQFSPTKQHCIIYISYTNFLPVSISIFLRSSLISLFHIFLGIFLKGFYVITDLTLLFSSLLIMFPSHCSLCAPIQLVTGATPTKSCTSLVYIFLQSSVALSQSNPHIFLNST